MVKSNIDKGYKIVAIVSAEASPTYGISIVGRWKDPRKKGRFLDNVKFVMVWVYLWRSYVRSWINIL